ncbi:MAG: O-antigen ligase family protein [Roseicyclus sp.]
MTELAPTRPRRARAVLTICPNALLACGAFAGLFFVLACGLSLFLLAPREAAGGLVDNGPILLLPAWCILSFAWSAHPELSMRYGIQLALTVAIGIAMATRLSPGTLLRALFHAGLLAAVASVLFGRARGDGGGYLGIYASKNDFGFAMVIVLCAATALTLGRDTGLRLRVLAGGAMLLSLALIVMAQSLGWLVAGTGLVAIGILVVLLRIVSVPLRILSVVLALLAMAALVQYAVIRADAFLVLFTETTGKDPTLTGRTLLWRVALDEIAQAPILGQGFGAWWVRGNPQAEAIWQQFGIASRTGFHFHNTWLSNWVEIGAVGVALQAAVFAWALWGSVRRALLVEGGESLFFAMLMVTLTVMSLGEVVAFMQFHTASVLVVAAAVFASRARREGILARSTRRALPKLHLSPMPEAERPGSGRTISTRSPGSSGVPGSASIPSPPSRKMR